MHEWIEGWLKEYKDGRYVRFSVVDKRVNKAIGTVEIFNGDDSKYAKIRKGRSILRIDVATKYESEGYLSELLVIADSFFYDFKCKNIITKAIPEATERINALTLNGYVPTPVGDGGNREHYYIKRNSR